MIYAERQFTDLISAPDYGGEEMSFIIHRESLNDKEWDQCLAESAKQLGFNIFNIKYNTTTFGAAAEIDQLCTLILNPYYNFALPMPAIPQYKKVLEEVLRGCSVFSIDPPHLTEDEQTVVKLLPNGWNSTMAHTYLHLPATRPFYRLSAGLPLYQHCLDNYSLLHPWLQRELCDEEVSLIMSHTFFDWLENVVANLPLLVDPNQQQSCNFDISGNAFKSSRCTPIHVIPAFKWDAEI